MPGWTCGPVHFAEGYSGQFVRVDPALNLVVVATTDWRSLTHVSAREQARRVEDIIGAQVRAAIK